MPHLLKRDSETLSIADWDWNYLLRLAQVHGWTGTGPISGSIATKDAQTLVAALERALPKIPEECTIAKDRGISALPDDPLEWFSGEGRIIVKQFIVFCHGGGFAVE